MQIPQGFISGVSLGSNNLKQEAKAFRGIQPSLEYHSSSSGQTPSFSINFTILFVVKLNTERSLPSSQNGPLINPNGHPSLPCPSFPNDSVSWDVLLLYSRESMRDRVGDGRDSRELILLVN